MRRKVCTMLASASTAVSSFSVKFLCHHPETPRVHVEVLPLCQLWRLKSIIDIFHIFFVHPYDYLISEFTILDHPNRRGNNDNHFTPFMTGANKMITCIMLWVNIRISPKSFFTKITQMHQISEDVL